VEFLVQLPLEIDRLRRRDTENHDEAIQVVESKGEAPVDIEALLHELTVRPLGILDATCGSVDDDAESEQEQRRQEGQDDLDDFK
jgi:hypothetical protein